MTLIEIDILILMTLIVKVTGSTTNLEQQNGKDGRLLNAIKGFMK